MPTLLVAATTGELPADFLLLLFCFDFDLRELFGLRFGVVRAFLIGVSSSCNQTPPSKCILTKLPYGIEDFIGLHFVPDISST